MSDTITLSRQELEELIREQSREGVMQALTLMGVDTKNPLEMQRDFQHLREWRTTSESIKSKGLLTIVGILVAGGGAAFWIGLKELIGR